MASCLSKKDTQSDEEIGIVENLIKYPSAFSVPPSFIKLTQVRQIAKKSRYYSKVSAPHHIFGITPDEILL